MVFRHVSKISVLKPQKTVQVISDSCLLHHVSCVSGLRQAKAIFEDRRSTPSGWVLERGVSRVSERVYSTHAPWKGKRWIKIPYRRNYSLKDSIMKIFGKKNKNTKKKSVVKTEQITVRRRTPMEGPKADMTPMKRKPFVVPKDKDLAANPKDTKKKKKKKHHHGLYDRPMDDEVISFKELCKNLKEPTTCETLKEKICPSAETCVKKPKEFCDNEEIEPDDGLKWHQRPSREFNPCLKPWLMREPSEINPKPKICEPEEEPFDWDNFNPCTPEKRKKRKKKTKDKRLSSLDNICEEMLGKPPKKRNRVRAKPCERSRTCPFKTTDGEHEGDVCVDFLDPWKKYETLDTQKEEKKEKQPPTDKCVDFLDPWKRYKAMAEGKCPSRQCRITITIRKCAKKKSKKPCKKPKKKKKKGCSKKGKKCSSTGSQGSQGTPPPIKCDGNPLPSQGSTASNATTTINGCTLMTTPTTGGIPKINPATLLGYMQSPPGDTPRNLHPPKKLPHLFEEHPNLPLKNPEPYKKPLVAHTPPCYRLPHYCSKSKRITLCDFTKSSQGTDTSNLAEPYTSSSEGKTTKKRMSSWTGSLTTVYETNMKPYKKGTVKSTNDLLSCSGVVYDLTMDEPCKSRFSGGAAKLSPSPNKGLAHKNGNPNSGKVYPREPSKPATNFISASLLVETPQNVPKPYKSSIPIRPNSRGGERNPKSSGECGKKSISTLSGSSNTPREATHKETPKTLNGEPKILEANPSRVQSGVTPKPTFETPPKIPTKIQTGAIFTRTTLVKVGVYHNPLYTYGYIPKTPAQPSGLVYKRPYSTNPTKTPLKEETTIGKTNTKVSVPQNPILAEGFGDGPKNGDLQINDLPIKNTGECRHCKTLPKSMSGGIYDPTVEPRNDTRVPHPGYFVDNPTTTKLGGFVKSKVTLFDAVFNRFHLNKHGVVVPKYDPPKGYFGNPCYRVGLGDTKKIPNSVVTYNPVSHPGDSLMKYFLNSGGLGKTLTFNRVCGNSPTSTRPTKENSLQNYPKMNFGVNPNSSYRHMHGSGSGGSGNDEPTTTIEDLLNPEPTNSDKDVILYKITLKNRQKLAKHLMGIELLEPNPKSIVANLQNPIGVVDLSAITNGDLGFSLKNFIETDTFASNPKSTLIEELKQKLINLEKPIANPIKELDYKWHLKGFQDYLHEKIDPNSNAEHKDPLLRIEQKEPSQKEDKVDPTKTTTLEDPLKILEVLAKKRKSKGPCKPKKCPPVCNPPKPCEATDKKKQEERLKKEKCEGKKPVDCSKKDSKGESKPTCPPPKKECIKRDLDNPPCLCPPKQLHPSQRKPCKKKHKRVCRRLGKKPEPELFECDICKRFQTYEEPKPRMKPTTCVAVKCKKKPSKCTVPIISKKRCLKRGRRQEICVTCPKPKAKVQCQSQPVAIMEEPTKCSQKKCGRKRRKKCVAHKSTQPPPPPPPDPCEEPNNPLREKKAKSKDCSETKKAKKPKKTKKKKRKKKKKKTTKKRRSGKKVCGKSKKCKKPKLDIFDHSKHTDWVAVPIRQGCGGCGEEIPKVIEKSKGDLPKFARDSGFHRVQGGQAAISGPVTQSMRTPRLDKELPKTQTPKKGLAENAQEILRSICDICKKGGKKCAGLLAFVDFSGWNFSVRAHHQELAFSEGGDHDDGNEGNGNGNSRSNYYTDDNYGNDDGNYGNYDGNYDDDDTHRGNSEEKNTTIYLST